MFCKRFLSISSLVLVFVGALTLFVASPVATASLLSNSGLETPGAGGALTTFANWAETSNAGDFALDSTLSVIGGSHSAQLNTSIGSFYQLLSPASGVAVFGMDYATLNTSTGSKAAFISLSYGITSGIGSITMRVLPNGELDVYDGFAGTPAYVNVGVPNGLVTTDTGTTKVWNGETPQTNHLTVALHFTAATPNYDVTLNGNTVTGLTKYQTSLPVSGATKLLKVAFGGDGAENANWLVDNITANTIPEPTTLSLLCTGLIGLLAYAWRRRK